jgi:hypothetical protein
MFAPTYYSPGSAIHSFFMFVPFFLTWNPAMWVQGAFLFATGPLLAHFITPNLQEQASIWCFFSIAQIAVMVFLIRNTLVKDSSATPAKKAKKN